MSVDLEREHEVKIRKAKRLLKEGHKIFDRKAYRGAINEYQRAISQLKWVEGEVEHYFDNMNFHKTLALLQTLWLWVAKAYQELGEAVEAAKCEQRAKEYQELERQCYDRFKEKETWRKSRNKKYQQIVSRDGGKDQIEKEQKDG